MKPGCVCMYERSLFIGPGRGLGYHIMAVLYQTERERPMERDVIREENRCVGEEIDWLLSECAADS